MKLFLPLFALAVLPFASLADDSNGNSAPFIVQNPHGGYNTIQSTKPPPSDPFIVLNPHGGYSTIQSTKPPAAIPFFGPVGFAHNAVVHSQDPKSFVLVPVVVDNGHGKYTVYKKVYYATPEDAAAAKAKL